MNIKLLLGTAVVISALTGLAVNKGSNSNLPPSGRNATTLKLPTVSVTESSPDGKHLFTLTLFEPWAEAGHRVALMVRASTDKDCLPSYTVVRKFDFGLGAEPLQLDGADYSCVFLTADGLTWSEVTDSGQVSAEVLQSR